MGSRNVRIDCHDTYKHSINFVKFMLHDLWYNGNSGNGMGCAEYLVYVIGCVCYFLCVWVCVCVCVCVCESSHGKPCVSTPHIPLVHNTRYTKLNMSSHSSVASTQPLYVVWCLQLLQERVRVRVCTESSAPYHTKGRVQGYCIL